jgi:subtilisin family serine protease
MKTYHGVKVKAVAALLLGVAGLSGCGGGGGGGGGSVAVPFVCPLPKDDQTLSAVNDPFVVHQWYLYNVGQSALTVNDGSGDPNSEGTYADIRVFDTLSTSAEAYALGHSGDGVIVAVVDSGLEIGHEDLAPNVLVNGSYNFYASTNGKALHDPTPPLSVDNPLGHHGTAVAGLAGARGGNELGIWGTAPSAELVGYNLLYSGFDLTMELAALGYVPSAERFPELCSANSDVFNLSYGRNPYIGTNQDAYYTSQIVAGLQAGTQTLRDGKGAVYVKAGGNEYAGGAVFDESWCAQAIANDVTCYNVNMENENVTPYQMVVGGFNADDKRASYANTGSALWMVGPGGEYGVNEPALITTDMSGCIYGFSQNVLNWGVPFNSDFNTGVQGTGNESCHYFSAFNGTSSSTPVMSGIVALLLEANPALSWRDVKHILASTARQLDPDLAAKRVTIAGQPVVLEDGWVENAAGYAFSNAYGFGAPDTQAAIGMALDWKASGTALESLQVTAPISGNVPTLNAIPDANPVGLSASVTVGENLTVESVELVVRIEDLLGVVEDGPENKIDMSDYQVVLRSPAGTESILLTPFNAYRAGYDMIDLKLISHAFYGEASQGDWTLVVRDLDNNAVDSEKNQIAHAGEGKLTAWSLKVYGRNAN